VARVLLGREAKCKAESGRGVLVVTKVDLVGIHANGRVDICHGRWLLCRLLSLSWHTEDGSKGGQSSLFTTCDRAPRVCLWLGGTQQSKVWGVLSFIFPVSTCAALPKTKEGQDHWL
jgi:hypothetical protein